MFDSSKNNSAQSITIVSTETTITGDIETSRDIRVEGTVKGNITSSGNIAIGDSGNIEGHVITDNLKISGKMTGDAMIKQKLIITSKGSLCGDVTTKVLNIEEGAFVSGKIIMESHP